MPKWVPKSRPVSYAERLGAAGFRDVDPASSRAATATSTSNQSAAVTTSTPRPTIYAASEAEKAEFRTFTEDECKTIGCGTQYAKELWREQSSYERFRERCGTSTSKPYQPGAYEKWRKAKGLSTNPQDTAEGSVAGAQETPSEGV